MTLILNLILKRYTVQPTREGEGVLVCVYGGRVHALVEIARMLDLKYGQSSDASRMSRVDYHATTYSY